ncbi:acyl-CoA dehydrogenase family protein [Sporichthya brevicatena]|uniref:Acyl-[acyl-carrier-protein] dehydrogenase MbtN n=1 Tax=Sporichthya brevicatena TaxID=171442 RepID=A0ABN1GQK3_9ACTN
MLPRTLFEPEHEQFRQTCREFLARHVTPHHAEWEANGIVDREVYVQAAKQGVLGFNLPEEFGGGGVDDFRFNVVANEEAVRAGASGPAFSLQSDIIAPYLVRQTTDEQKARWLPAAARGELIVAVAMSEPNTGSDLQGIQTRAVRDGDDWILTGNKIFISSGIHADLVLVVARTDPDAPAHRGMSLLAVERDMPGFTRGRKLEKLGLRAQDTAELNFDEVRVPAANVVGEVNGAFAVLMANLPEERLSIAVHAVASAREILDQTLEYVKTRTAFGRPIGTFQNSRFVLAELDTEVGIAQVYLDRCVSELVAGKLSEVEAARAKYWTTELQNKVIDRCLQLHGGYGFMLEYPVSKAYADARAQTIYGGSTEIMKEIIGRSLGLGDPR